MDYTTFSQEMLEWIQIGLLIVVIIFLYRIARKIGDIGSTPPPDHIGDSKSNRPPG